MREILFLAHRIPYPPNKGDKIRSWHLLEGLAARFRVHLGTFVDDPDDWQHVAKLREVCGEVCVRPLDPRVARLRSLAGLFADHALTLDYYRDAQLFKWTRRLARERPLAGTFAYSSSMAPYAEGLLLAPGARRVLDLCDVDSDKWRQYASARAWPMSWVFSREARLLATAERRYVGSFDSTLVIAPTEAEILRRLAPESAERIGILPNGVDTSFFDPDQPYPNPFPADSRSIVFTGAMDYHPNVDGVAWFADEILPQVRARVPRAQFWIVGSKPTAEVRSLARREGVRVTGRVSDIRPYLAHASVIVAPLRIARGVQNKVLEGLAMARPLVATPNAVQGIEGIGRNELVVASSAGEFSAEVVRALELPLPTRVIAARDFVAKRLTWDAQLDVLAALLQVGHGLAPARRSVTVGAAPVALPGSQR
jgi:sugar transferase (PEP-CTERM/EpsH1 system associated)